MTLDEIEKIYLSSYFLLKFRYLLNDLVFKNFLLLLKTLKSAQDIQEIFEKYSSFLFELNKKGYDDFSKYVLDLINENKINFSDENSLNPEIEIISSLLKINFEEIKNLLLLKFEEFSSVILKMPKFKTSDFSFDIKTLKTIEKSDDIYKLNRAFVFDKSLEIYPIDFIEKTKFKDLKGYQSQKKVLLENTSSLLKGKKVNNILLYGDAGCGKSTSVRALLNEFQELKIVQIFKDNLINLDKLYLKLKDLPYYFIIFADDISFDFNDATFSTMKAILEGSIIQCPKNVAIYATSNRRHLIREDFQARKGDEIHLNDTLNETSSLSERFGINLLFQKPNPQEFNEIVLKLAKDNNIEIDDNLLIEKANRLALIKGSRSPRVARQFIDNCINHVSME